MDTCFLFTEHLNDEGCWFLKLTPEGILKNHPAFLNFNEIKTLQIDCHTVLVESCKNTTLIDLELPWLAERKARAAIPFALEDKVAQPVEELHFAFDKVRYQNNHYLITIIAKQRLQYLIQMMDQHAIRFQLITLDWFALDDGQACICEQLLLINHEQFKGVLSNKLALQYIKQNPTLVPVLFQNSHLPLQDSASENLPDHSSTWIAKKLLKTKPFNLCQGDMQHGTTATWIKKGYTLSAVCAGIWLISILIVNAITLNSLNKKTSTLDAEIGVIYHHFFPEAKQVISPRFRINQLLKNNGANDQNQFWSLLNQFSKVMEHSSIVTQQLRYQNKTLSVTVVSPDFVNLEQLENDLKKVPLKVNQTEASTHDKQVMATLELSS